MAISTEKVFDPETSSTASFEEVPSTSEGETKDLVVRSSGPDSTVKTPDVLYVLQYLGFANKVIESRESTVPFKVIPEYGRKNENKDGAKQPEKPILEIVTKVSTQYSYGKNTRRRRGYNPPPGDYDEYQYDNYDYNDQISDSDEEPEMKISKIEKTVMLIHSEHLINALKAVVAYYPYANLIGKPVAIDAPYRLIVHHRAALAEYKSNQPTCHSSSYARKTAAHIDVLLTFLDKTMGAELREEEARHQKAIPMATFDKFWLALKPGEVIFGKRSGLWTPYVLSNITQAASTDGRPTSYQVNCWYLEYNNTKIMRMMAAFNVAPWTGEQAIRSMEVIPSRFFPDDPAAMLEKQVRLGKLYWELLKRPTYMEYDGLLMAGGPGHGQFHRGPSGYMTGRVICDAEGYGRFYQLSPEYSRGGRGPPPQQHPPPPQKDHLPHYQPRCACRSCSNDDSQKDIHLFAGFEDMDPLKSTAPTSDLFYTVCSNVIAAFMLGDRRWGHLNLESLKPVTPDREAFKYLVLEEEVKLTVKALIGQFAAGEGGKVSPWANDFVQHKGSGRIALLHGEPGVGKTCTAECVAELTRRPLISLTSGDLSVNSFSVENNLNYFLQLGERFGAIVLLDEADVYLERRRAKDISRNGLVSVFLRALEYYRGVLFLTTNRVQAFDTAFTSRIHVALHYKNLTDADRERIWANNFTRLDRDSAGRVHVSVATREYAYESRDVRSLRWNGREIRNALQTALALAESDATEEGATQITISDKHLRAVVKMSRGFKDYLKSGRNYDDESDGEYAGEDDDDVDDEEGGD